jgi:hypothetical protein
LKKFLNEKGYKKFKWPSGDELSEIGYLSSQLSKSILGYSSQDGYNIKIVGENVILISVEKAENTYFIIEISSISNHSSLFELFWYNTYEFLPGPDKEKCRIWCSNQVKLIAKNIIF